MNHEDHRKVTALVFNAEWNDVHKWLDEDFEQEKANGNAIRHWIKRHHKKAIKAKYGEGTAQYNVAYLHILCDFLYRLSIPMVPLNEIDVENILLEENVV